MHRAFVVIVIVICAAVVGSGCCTPGVILWSMTPAAPFDPAAAPAAPDYDDDASWIALPQTKDEADIALPASPPTTSPAVDVFYVHSTSSVAAQWNSADVGDVRAASISGGTLIQASAFNACCAVYAPGYRQAAGVAFTSPSTSGDMAIDVAAGDVTAAFAAFRRRTGARPFMLVAHSQGSVITARLLRDVIASSPERANLVAAYLIGAPLTADDTGGVPVCETSTSTGCVIAYNARAPGHVKNEIEFGVKVADERRICVNPTTGSPTTMTVPRDAHGGAVFFDAETPAVLPAFLQSTCHEGRLVVEELQPLPSRGVASAVLLQLMGGTNYHPVEYQLFYMDLRKDAVRRAAAFGAATSSP